MVLGFLSCIGIGIVKSTFQVLVSVLVLLSSSTKVLVLGRNFGIGQLCPQSIIHKRTGRVSQKYTTWDELGRGALTIRGRPDMTVMGGLAYSEKDGVGLHKVGVGGLFVSQKIIKVYWGWGVRLIL